MSSIKHVFVVASGGGHWEQMMLLRQAFDGHRTSYATTLDGLCAAAGLSKVYVVPECNQDKPLQVVRCAFALLALLLRKRPDVVVSTGALPGLIALILGRRLGARTIWVDSIANAEEMSRAGLRAKPHADLWLSQWPEVANRSGASYAGSVL